MNPYYHPLFLHFIVYFNDNQDYFECHEVLEEYWKMQDDFSKNHPLTAYILLATGMYHWRRGNVTGASRTMNKALHRFQQMPAEFESYHDEVEIEKILHHIQESLDCMQSGTCFTAFPLPVSSALLAASEEVRPAMTLLPKNSASVIHKHMQRDRSDILLQREEKKKGSS